jgi:DNA-binding transcriptional LysR family regulator
MAAAEALLATGFRHFMAVAEAGSIRAAARHINVSPSAISRQLTLLEAQLDMPLFERSAQRLMLTPAGELLLRGLRRVNDEQDDTLSQIAALRGLKRGHVRVASVESLTAFVLPTVLAEFAARHPGIQVSLTVAGSDAVTELVRDHSADLGFTFNQQSLRGLAIDLVCNVAVGAVLSPRHPLARARSIDLARCAEHPMAWPAQGLSLRRILDVAAAKANLTLPPAIEFNSLRLMAALAESGGFIAFQTRIGIERELAAGSLLFRNLADRNLQPDRLMLISREGHAGAGATEAFRQCAIRHLPSAGSVPKNRTG